MSMKVGNKLVYNFVPEPTPAEDPINICPSCFLEVYVPLEKPFPKFCPFCGAGLKFDTSDVKET